MPPSTLSWLICIFLISLLLQQECQANAKVRDGMLALGRGGKRAGLALGRPSGKRGLALGRPYGKRFQKIENEETPYFKDELGYNEHLFL